MDVSSVEVNKFKIVQNLNFVSNGGVHWKAKLIRPGYLPNLDFHIEPVKCLLPMDTLISVEVLPQKDGFENVQKGIFT